MEKMRVLLPPPHPTHYTVFGGRVRENQGPGGELSGQEDGGGSPPLHGEEREER